MVEYSIKEYTAIWRSKYNIDTKLRRWLFPFHILNKDKDTKMIVNIYKSGWFSNRVKKIDDILDNTNKAVIAHTEAMIELKELIKAVQTNVDDLKSDYKSFKSQVDYKLDKMKDNFWLNLFGVK